MPPEIDRRDFLASAPAAMYLAGTVLNSSHAAPPAAAGAAKLEPFDYQGVTLRASRWKAQADAGREFYLGLVERRHPLRRSEGRGTAGAADKCSAAGQRATATRSWASG